MKYFGTSEERGELHARLSHSTGVVRCLLLVRLAWYFRECDTSRAIRLAEEAESLLAQPTELTAAESSRCQARLQLTRASVQLRHGRFGDAKALLRQGRERFQALADAGGASDACRIESDLYGEMADKVAERRALKAAVTHAEGSGDMERAALCLGAMTWSAIAVRSADAGALVDRFRAYVEALQDPLFDAEEAAVNGALHDFGNDYARSIIDYQRCFELRQANGQLWYAINAANLVSRGYRNIGDNLQAIEWAQRALGVARSVGWPMSMARCLQMLAASMREVREFTGARDLLTEALDVLLPLGRSNALWQTYQHLSEVVLDFGEFDEALRLADEADRVGGELQYVTLSLRGRLARAMALSGLNRPVEALAQAQKTLAIATEASDSSSRIKALIEMANMACQHGLPLPEGSTSATAEIHYLESALAIGEEIENHCISSDLLSRLSRAFETAGDLTQSIACERRASGARARDDSKKASALATLRRHVQMLTDDKLALERETARLAREALIAKMQERERIARDLHDTLLQSVTGLILRFQSVLPRIPPGGVHELVERTLELADRTLEEGRNCVLDLRRPAADLARALESAGRGLELDHPSRFSVAVEGQPRILTPSVEEEVYYIGREALLNAFRHARARSIRLCLSYRATELYLAVRDDGCGIASEILAAGARPGHSGLLGLRERAMNIGALLEIRRLPQGGTLMELHVPCIDAP